MIEFSKQHAQTSHYAPLEQVTVKSDHAEASYLIVHDAAGRPYVERSVKPGQNVRFNVRGAAGRHELEVLDADRRTLESQQFTLKPATSIDCAKGPYANLADRIRMLMTLGSRRRPFIVDGKLYDFFVSWGRDHTHVMKSMKYFHPDVKSGIEFFLERQQPSGMFWDDCHPNHNRPYPSWFNEALGEGYWDYSDDMQYTIRRIPCEADVEFLYTECVWYAWKASGDDAWMAEQLPRLEKALAYNNSHPTRWSEKHQLVKRVHCMDSWDFQNPHFCHGDHRRINEGDPFFLFHSDNSGLYASYWRIAEMHEAAGNTERAKELRQEGEALRRRANRKLFFDTQYGHMIPDDLPAKQVYDLVGDERQRMSLSTGYTINRRLPTHEMAVKILREYQRRGKAKKGESFAEWWTMDPPYEPEQWPGHGPPKGEYVNGGICAIVAGELAKAAFDHGMEDYGVDILDRLWALSEWDGGELHQVYRRLPEAPPQPNANFQHVDLRPFTNVGLKHDRRSKTPGWTGEPGNDMRNLPVGTRRFGDPAVIEFDVIDPDENDGTAIVRLDSDPAKGWGELTIPVDHLTGRSLYFMHALSTGVPLGSVVGSYDILYADGSEQRIHLRNGHELSLWWGITDNPDTRRHNHPVDRSIARVAWQGPNAQWKNVGLFMTGWNNPKPETPIVGLRAAANSVRAGGRRNDPGSAGRKDAGIMLAAVSVSDEPVKFEESIRSYGLPDNWSQAAVYYAIAEGLCGVEDRGRAFDRVALAPRWAATDSDRNDVCLHYPASDGYCAYRYRHDPKRNRITLDVTGSFREAELHVLMPGRRTAKRVEVDGRDHPFEKGEIEGSRYADFQLNALPTRPIVIEY